MTRVQARRQQSGAASEPFERPALIKDHHVLLNADAPDRWWRFGVKDDHPLTRAYEQGKLASGRREYSARDRWLAGLIYRGLYEDLHGSGTASSNLNRITGAGSEPRAGEKVCTAREMVNRLETIMGGDHAFIVRRVCGEGAWPSEAVRARYDGFDKVVSQTFCAALDALISAVLQLKIHTSR